MIRKAFGGNQEIDAYGFRLRGREVTRVEALSDAVFGFAITLLVVSLDVPKSFSDLMQLMNGFVSFGVTFALLLMIWYVHYVFFRRYGLQDFITIVLNAVLLFVVVFYIYPLKFMFTLVFGNFVGFGGVNASRIEIEASQAVPLMVLYALSIIIVFSVFTAMHLHAWRKRDELGLDALERHVTIVSLRYCLIWVGVSLLSMLVAVVGGLEWVAISGMLYAILGPLAGLNGYFGAKRAPKRDVAAFSEEAA